MKMLFVTLTAALLAGYTHTGAHKDFEGTLVITQPCLTMSNAKRLPLVYYPAETPWQMRSLQTGPIFEGSEDEWLAKTPPLLETPEPLPSCLNFIQWA